MLNRGLLADMANAADFNAAAELLSSTEYAIPGGATEEQIERLLLDRRSGVRRLFMDLMLDESTAQMLNAREDFLNMRLAIRRLVTEKPLGLDYSNEGSVPAEEFEEIFQQENYERFPDYLQDAVEAAILGYYENKDIRRIDYEIDRVEHTWRVRRADELGSVFCDSMARIQADLYNIRTMLRLKAAERDERGFFLPCGFVEPDKYHLSLSAAYESISALFFATPYYELLEEGIRYFRAEGSFLKLEQQCEDYLMGFLRTTREIAAGPQPVIAFAAMKEAEIRAVRMMLIGKKNGLSSKMLLDRLGHWHG